MRSLTMVLLAALAAAPAASAQKKGKQPPDAGTVFQVSPTKPGWVTCDIELRDPADVLWPNLYYGKPAAEGSFTFDKGASKVALALRCDVRAQRAGDQSRRVLGELLKSDKGDGANLSIAEMRGLKTEEIDVVAANGKKSKKKVEYAPWSGALKAEGREAAVSGKATFRWGYARNEDKPESVYLELTFAVKAADLGLRKASGDLVGRAGITAYARWPGQSPKR